MILFLVHRAADADDARALAWRLRWHDCTPSAVWTAPDHAAATTAAILAEVLDWPGPIERHDELAAIADAPDAVDAPDARDPTAITRALTAADSHVTGFAIVVVGHEPQLSAIAAHFFAGPALAPLAPGEALRLDGAEVRWRFSHDGAAPVRGPEPP